MHNFGNDLIKGLSSPNKYLPSKYFYDENGDKLFQAILDMPEYYLTKCEFEIFNSSKEHLLQYFQNGSEEFELIEFGAGDGVDASNTYFLRLQGWNCLLLDRLFEIPEYNLHKEFISKENINDLFYKYEVPFDLDLLSIDIDYNDFYVWMALDPKFEAKVVVIECNATHPPDEDKVVQYRRLYAWDGTNYFGASVQALYNLGKAKG